MSSRYDRNNAWALAAESSCIAGQPPRLTTSERSATEGLEVFLSDSSRFPSNRSARETWDDEYPDSLRDNVRIRMRSIRAAPECFSSSSFGVAEPVRMNWPLLR